MLKEVTHEKVEKPVKEAQSSAVEEHASVSKKSKPSARESASDGSSASGTESDVSESGIEAANMVAALDEDEDDADREFSAVFAAVEEARTSFVDREQNFEEDIRVTVIGGTWSASRTGEAVYGIRCDVRPNTCVMEVCVANPALHKSATFKNTVYGDHGSDLARLWCHRMAWLADAWLHRGSGRSRGESWWSGYREPTELVEKLAEGSAAVQKRCQAILTLQPEGS
eukprot:3167612-Amphidinium_carterae.1